MPSRTPAQKTPVQTTPTQPTPTQTTRISDQIRELHEALLDIVSLMNRPQRDEVLIKEAGISLERGLFPLLVGIARFGPIGVVELADRVGRDYTTVSRQVTRLLRLGLARRQGRVTDRRVRQAVITAKGKAMTRRVDAARERIGRSIFQTWKSSEVGQLVRLVRKFADAVNEQTSSGRHATQKQNRR
jgi:DNA-binding MarR family transcriptional regulator